MPDISEALRDYQGAVQFTDPLFGGIGDGETDNADAWNAFGDWARAESTAGRGVVLNLPPGTYNFDHDACVDALYNIKSLIVEGNGSIIQNTYDFEVGGASNGERPWFTAWGGNLFGGGKLISSTAVGATTVTLSTPSEHSSFAVGHWVGIGSFDIQSYGYPPNMQYWEFVQITAINTGTGVISVTPALRYAHRSDFPDYEVADQLRCGKARIWPLGGSTTDWDVSHEYRNLHIRKAPNTELTYTSVSGRHIRFTGGSMTGISETVCDRCETIGTRIEGFSEPDKLVDSIFYDSVVISSPENNGSFAFQSSSINRVTFQNCKINGLLNLGTAKHIYLENCDIEQLNPGGGLGVSSAISLINCRIFSMPNAVSILYSQPVQYIDGATVTFADGVISVPNDGADIALWAVPPGIQINLLTTHNLMSGNIGTGIVTKVLEDSTHVHIHTTLPYATLPSWATGRVRVADVGKLDFINCSGSDNARMASEATARGFYPWELFRVVFAGQYASNGQWGSRVTGDLVAARFNVIQPSPVANVMSFAVGTVTKNAMDDQKVLTIKIDTAVTGKRVFTQTALTGKVGNDDVLLVAATQSTLPTNRWLKSGGNASFEWSQSALTPSSYDPFELPVIEVEFELDTGIFRKRIPARLDGTTNAVANISGMLP